MGNEQFEMNLPIYLQFLLFSSKSLKIMMGGGYLKLCLPLNQRAEDKTYLKILIYVNISGSALYKIKSSKQIFSTEKETIENIETMVVVST